MASDANLNKQLDVAKCQLYRLLQAKKPETLSESETRLLAELDGDMVVQSLLNPKRK